SRRRHTRFSRDWSSDVCSSDLLFLSFRHMSMIMLYRPATDEIVWKKQGPWLAQHDVDILDATRIGVFNNNAYDRGTDARIHGTRSEERRVGKEGRWRWAPRHRR